MADGSRDDVKIPTGVRRCTLADLWLVCRELRPDEIEHTLALTQMETYDHEALALSLANLPGPKISLVDEADRAYLCGGAMEVSPGVFEGWMAGTMAGWAKHGMRITRVSRWFQDVLFFEHDAHRLQVTTLASRETACQWYAKGLRMTRESVKRGFGKRGEDCVEFARLRDDR